MPRESSRFLPPLSLAFMVDMAMGSKRSFTRSRPRLGGVKRWPPVSTVPVLERQVSMNSIQWPRWSWPRGEAPFRV